MRLSLPGVGMLSAADWALDALTWHRLLPLSPDLKQQMPYPSTSAFQTKNPFLF